MCMLNHTYTKHSPPITLAAVHTMGRKQIFKHGVVASLYFYKHMHLGINNIPDICRFINFPGSSFSCPITCQLIGENLGIQKKNKLDRIIGVHVGRCSPSAFNSQVGRKIIMKIN
jgi:hypothetical protein